jgi:hypothetical protein
MANVPGSRDASLSPGARTLQWRVSMVDTRGGWEQVTESGRAQRSMEHVDG